MIKASTPANKGIDILWQPATLLAAVAAAELLALILALGAVPGDGILVRFGIYSFAILWILLFTLGTLRLLEASIRRCGIASMVIVGLLAMACVTFVSAGLAASGLQTLFPDALGVDWPLEAMRLYLCMMAMAFFGLLALHGHWSVHALELRARQAEFDRLRARVNPHFLFNTLNIASVLVHERPDQAESVLLDLSDLFRAALSDRSEHPIADELALVRRYLDIEALRLGERLQVEWNKPDILPADTLPVLSIQPLVENAVRHGIEALSGGGRVRISVSASPRELLLRVVSPMPTQPSPQSNGHQVGLAATRARIENFSNGAGRLDTRLADGEFVAEIILPRESATST